MNYYPSNAVDALLKCAFCSEKFVFAVKLIPDCGNSICGKCYEQIKETSLKSRQYQCKACGDGDKWHTMPENGLTDIQILSKMLQLKPETKALPPQAVALKMLINDTNGDLSKICEINELKEVNEHCDRLVEAVKKSIETKILQLKNVSKEQLKEIEDYRSQMVASLDQTATDRPSKRLRTSYEGTTQSAEQELGELKAKIGKFNQEWQEYFTKISKVATEADFERAKAELRGFAAKIQELEPKLKSDVFGNNYLEWRESDFCFQKYHLGGLANEQHALTPSDTPPSSTETPVASYSTVGQSTPRPDHYGDSAPKSRINRHMTTLAGHSKSVYDVTFASDSVLASCYADSTIKIWPFQSGERILQIKVPNTVASSLMAMNNGWLVAGCRDGSIMIWDLGRRELVKSFNAHRSSIFKVRALPDGNLVSISWDNTINVWNPYTLDNNLVASMSGHDIKWDVLDVGVLSNGHLVTCTNDKNVQKDCIIRVWDPKVGAEHKLILTKHRGVSAFTVLSDDKLALGFYNGLVSIYDLHEEKELGTLTQIHYFKILCIIQLPNGNLAISTCNREPKVYIVDQHTGTLVETITTGHADKLKSFRISPDGRSMASFSSDQKVKLWTLP